MFDSIRATKKASLLIAFLCVSVLLNGCVAQLLSAAGGILAGLGQAFGGQTGQILGQIGQVLGGVGAAFGQQQQGVAGQLAGAAGGIPGLNPGQQGGIPQIPGLDPGQQGGIPGLNPGQVPGLNPGQQAPQQPGLNLPNVPGFDVLQRVTAQLGNIPNPTPDQIAAAARAAGENDPARIQQIIQQILVQRQPGPVPNVPQQPGFPPVGQGAPAPNFPGAPGGAPGGAPQIPNFPGGQAQIPGFNPGGFQGNGGFQQGLQIAQGVINIINLIRGAQNQPNAPVPQQQPQVQFPAGVAPQDAAFFR